MKTGNIIQLIILLSGVLAFSCKQGDIVVKDSVEHYDNGNIKKFKLNDDSVINNLNCQNWVHYWPNGAVDQIQLSGDQVVSGIKFPGGSVIFFDETGNLKSSWLSRDIEIQGYKCQGGFMKIETGFYPSGKLRMYFPSDDIIIDGVPCKGGVFSGIYFHENGRLKKAKASESFTRDGKTYNEGDIVEL